MSFNLTNHFETAAHTGSRIHPEIEMGAPEGTPTTAVVSHGETLKQGDSIMTNAEQTFKREVENKLMKIHGLAAMIASVKDRETGEFDPHAVGTTAKVISEMAVDLAFEIEAAQLVKPPKAAPKLKVWVPQKGDDPEAPVPAV